MNESELNKNQENEKISKIPKLNNIEKILLAKPRGFCAGVQRAIEIVEKCCEIYDKPIYIKHQIVHNKHITQRFAQKGVISIENIENIPDNSTVIFSAHGSPPEDFMKAKEKNLKIIDAICPLVLKVHTAVKNLTNKTNNYKIIYIGKKNHIEAKSVYAQNKDKITIIENEADIKELTYNKNEKIACLTQTTLNVGKTQKIINKLKEKFPQILLQEKNDICYATTNRQNIVSKIRKKTDLFLIVGSKNSSNTKRLLEIAKEKNSTAYLIEDITRIKNEWFDNTIKTIAISSGASVPEDLVEEIINYFKNNNIEIMEYEQIEESMKFILPKELLKENLILNK